MIIKVECKKGATNGPLETKKSRDCEKGGIAIMDQPINLPSLFISLRCRCVEIQNNPSRGRNHAKRPKSFIPPVFPCFRRLSSIIPP